MSSVKFTNKKLLPTALLTRAEKLTAIEEIFGENFSHQAKFFPLDGDFYAELKKPKGYNKVADKLFNWWGVKHRGVHLIIETGQAEPVIYTHHGQTHEIKLSEAALNNPYEAAAVIAHGLMHYILIGRHSIYLSDESENEELTDLALINSGMGAVILNGYNYHIGWLNRLSRLKDLQPVGVLKPREFLAETETWMSAHHLPLWELSAQLMPWVSIYLPRQIRAIANKKLHVLSEEKAVKTTNVKFLGVLILASIIGIVAGYLLILVPTPTPKSLIAKQQVISTLRSQFDQCLSNVEQKKKDFDTSDIFVLRVIQSDIARCESLRNRYNSEISSYNALAKKY